MKVLYSQLKTKVYLQEHTNQESLTTVLILFAGYVPRGREIERERERKRERERRERGEREETVDHIVSAYSISKYIIGLPFLCTGSYVKVLTFPIQKNSMSIHHNQ